MDFGEVLEEWEKNRKTPTIRSEDKRKECEAHWLESYPPGKKEIAEKAEVIRSSSKKRKNLKRLKSEKICDLHGLTRKEAQKALDQFVKNNYNLKIYKILVIHGKGLHSPGEPVLKKTVIEYMRNSKLIAEWGSCLQKDGGDGATWATLKEPSY